MLGDLVGQTARGEPSGSERPQQDQSQPSEQGSDLGLQRSQGVIKRFFLFLSYCSTEVCPTQIEMLFWQCCT